MSTSTVVKFSRLVDAGELASMIQMLPPLPEVAHTILQQFGDEFISGNDIADIVECDPAISARLFALANSAYFGQVTPVTKMREVVSRVLGPDTVRSLAFALATEQVFDLSKCKHFDSGRFWRRSLYCASAADRVSKVVEDINLEVKDFSYLAGLCHNLGVLAVACCYPDEASAIFDRNDGDDGADFNQLCREQFGFCTDDVTYELAAHWGMPSLIVESYRHRAVGEAQNNLLAAILNASVKSARYSQRREAQQDNNSVDQNQSASVVDAVSVASSTGGKSSSENLVEVPNFDEDLPYVEVSTLTAAALGSDRDHAATQSRLQTMLG